MNSAHILFSISAWIVLLLASVLALLASAEHIALKRSVMLGVWQKFPPLPFIERGVFILLYIGFGALSSAFITMLPSYTQWWSSAQQLKTALALGAWLSLAALLVGHWWRGWRSGTATGWALFGTLLLGLAYASSSLSMDTDSA